MNYQTVLCLGDSLTYGARTYDCYPMILAKILTLRTRYLWRMLNVSRNGATARSLWFQLNDGSLQIKDAYIACLLIGTNDASAQSDPQFFEEYYRQILRALALQGFRSILCGTIPPFHCDGHAFFTREGEAHRPELNLCIERAVSDSASASLVDLSGVEKEHCVDPAHFNSAGNAFIAERFAEALIRL